MWKWALFLIVILGNNWIWKIIESNFWLGMVVVMACILLFLEILPRWGHSIYNFNGMLTSRWLALVVLMMVLMWQQWVMTNRVSLNDVSAEERFMRQDRVGYYPEFFRRAGVWWELRPEMVGARKVGENFFQAVDLNYYFFANHPREVVGVPIVEKFPFIFLPLFLIGLAQLMKFRKMSIKFWWLTGWGFVFPIGFLSMIGHDNPLGPVVMFPGMVAVTYLGMEVLVKKLLIKLFKGDPS